MKELLMSTICSLVMSICCFSCFPYFGYEGRASVLFASVPGHCLPFTFLLKSCSNGMRIS